MAERSEHSRTRSTIKPLWSRPALAWSTTVRNRIDPPTRQWSLPCSKKSERVPPFTAPMDYSITLTESRDRKEPRPEPVLVLQHRVWIVALEMQESLILVRQGRSFLLGPRRRLQGYLVGYEFRRASDSDHVVALAGRRPHVCRVWRWFGGQS